MGQMTQPTVKALKEDRF